MSAREFVELYNAGNEPLNLSSWSLKYFRSDSTSTNSLALFDGSNNADKVIIPAKGYLLVGLNNYNAVNYNGTAADILRTASLPNVSGSSEGVAVTVYLFDSGGAGVGGLVYTNASISQAGQSLERKAKPAGNCVSAGSGEGEFSGNSCNGNSSGDFETRSQPKPQNSGSLPEPRSAPNLTGATLAYSSSTMSLAFKWNEAFDSAGDALSVIYEIRNASTSGNFRYDERRYWAFAEHRRNRPELCFFPAGFRSERFGFDTGEFFGGCPELLFEFVLLPRFPKRWRKYRRRLLRKLSVRSGFAWKLEISTSVRECRRFEGR